VTVPGSSEPGERDDSMVVAGVLLVLALLGLTSLHVLEPSYPPSTATVSEYALSPSGWVFTAALLALAAGSALVVRRVWAVWPVRRWLLLVWAIGSVVVALVTTDPAGVAVTLPGRLHAASASLGIGALIVAEVGGAFSDVGRRAWSAAAAGTALVALALAPLVGFGTSERIVIAVHIGWLLVLCVHPPARGPGAPVPAAP
jgi:hypothetical protein